MTKEKSKTTQTDIEIGKRIRMLRLLCNKSQEDIGKDLNVSFQQIQKYESGHNRVAASKLPALEISLHTSMIDIVHGTIEPTESSGLLHDGMFEFSRLKDHQQESIIRIMREIRG